MKRLCIILAFLPFTAFAQNKVGINTKTPATTLDVNGNIAIRTVAGLTTATKAKDSVLVMEGGVVKATTAANVVTQAGAGSSAAFGDVKTGIQSADHGGWVKLDGRALSTLTSSQQTQAGSLGLTGNLPNATGAYLGQNGGAIGTVSGNNSKSIAQNNLPNARLYLFSPFNSTVANDISNNVNYKDQTVSLEHNFNNNYNYAFQSNTDYPSRGLSASINGNVTQVAFDVTPKTLNVNTFIYLGP